ncbi:MAG TPA: galactosyltransferase-related protein [Streptosporangiaceae bacterium]|jgi:hypothetical protein
MSWGQPEAGEVAASVLSSVVVSADEFAQEAALDYWDMSAAAHREVVALLRGALAATPAADDGGAAGLAALDAVLAAPARPDLIAVLAGLIGPGVAMACAEQPAGGPAAGEWRALAGQAVRADVTTRLYMHTGTGYRASVPEVTAAVLSRPDGDAAPGPGPVPVQDPGTAPAAVIVIPFRDRSDGQGRLRNLLACLRALGDQSVPRPRYRTVVVELDAEPRHEKVIGDRADQYLFLSCPGHFNKAWGVNAGVVQAGNNSPVICILDADVLVDRDFLARNLARFGTRGHQAHWPFRDPLCLDPPSANAAVTQRCIEGKPDVDPELVRGVHLRQPPGHCVWLRDGLFRRIGGMDERFEGWGGEDLDFVYRLNVVGPLDRYDDRLLHLYHPRPQITKDGERFYAGRQLLTWRPAGPIGQPDGPCGSVGDDLAGIIRGAS